MFLCLQSTVSSLSYVSSSFRVLGPQVQFVPRVTSFCDLLLPHPIVLVGHLLLDSPLPELGTTEPSQLVQVTLVVLFPLE